MVKKASSDSETRHTKNNAVQSKNAVCVFSELVHKNYFVLTWKIPKEISRRSMIFSNYKDSQKNNNKQTKQKTKTKKTKKTKQTNKQNQDKQTQKQNKNKQTNQKIKNKIKTRTKTNKQKALS